MNISFSICVSHSPLSSSLHFVTLLHFLLHFITSLHLIPSSLMAFVEWSWLVAAAENDLGTLRRLLALGMRVNVTDKVTSGVFILG